MRALLVSPSSVPGGAERAFASLARHLPAHGCDVHAVLLQPGPLEGWLDAAGCPVEVLEAGRTRHLHRTGATIARLARRARDVDVVISNQSKGHVYGGLAAALAGRPALWWQQGTPSRSRIEGVAARIPAAAVVASSDDSLKAQRRITPHRRVERIALGIDVGGVEARKGTGRSLRDANGWHTDRLVGIVGRLQEWKGQDVFLRAAAEVAASRPDVRFVVVGGAVLGWEGDYPASLRRLATELGIAERVDFVGHQDDVYPWFDALDVVVHASYGEPFGLVLVEAMALGKPLVATAAGGPVEIVEDGTSGVLVPAGDHAAMADAIGHILDDERFRDGLQRGAALRARHFDERRMAEHFASLLDDVVGPAQLGGAATALAERTVPGLHGHVFDRLVEPMERCAVLDIGAGTGAFAQRLVRAGFDVLAVDRDGALFAAPVPFREVDLDQPGWEDPLGTGQWPVVVAVAVIEHLEAPVAFLRAIARLLAPGGQAIITTPNVDSLPARGKFLLRGTLRMLDEHGDPTHISPIFWDLLVRQYLPRAGLRLVHSETFPPAGFVAGRPMYRRLLGAASPFLRGQPRLLGDNHVLVLTKSDMPSDDLATSTMDTKSGHAVGRRGPITSPR